LKGSLFRFEKMTYLTCTKHSRFQRKHIDVCRQCPDNDGCDAFQAYIAIEPPPPPPPDPAETTIPVRLFLQELEDIRKLVADTTTQRATEPEPRRKKPLQGIELVDFIRSELEGIKKLC
jgi:hypothetical protein